MGRSCGESLCAPWVCALIPVLCHPFANELILLFAARHLEISPCFIVSMDVPWSGVLFAVQLKHLPLLVIVLSVRELKCGFIPSCPHFLAVVPVPDLVIVDTNGQFISVCERHRSDAPVCNPNDNDVGIWAVLWVVWCHNLEVVSFACSLEGAVVFSFLGIDEDDQKLLVIPVLVKGNGLAVIESPGHLLPSYAVDSIH